MEDSLVIENTNCGLDSLSQMMSIKGVSMGTLISLAKDNGMNIYPYQLFSDIDYQKISYPAIIHSDNHFMYADKFEDVDIENVTGKVLLSEKSPYKLISNPENVKGESWVAAAVGVGTLAYGIYQNQSGKKEAKKGERKLAMEAAKKNKAAEERQKRLESQATMGGEMPGEARRKNVIGATTAQRLTASKEASTTAANQQAMIAQAVLSKQDEFGKLAAESEQYQQDRTDAATEGLGDMANLEEGARDRMMALAEGQVAKGEAMKGAGQQNIAGGATSLAGNAPAMGAKVGGKPDPRTEAGTGSSGRIGESDGAFGGSKRRVKKRRESNRMKKLKGQTYSQSEIDEEDGGYELGSGSRGSFGFRRNKSFGR